MGKTQNQTNKNNKNNKEMKKYMPDKIFGNESHFQYARLVQKFYSPVNQYKNALFLFQTKHH